MRGVGAVRDYFKALLQEEHITKRRDVKVVIVGEAGAGKTRYECEFLGGEWECCIFINRQLYMLADMKFLLAEVVR